VSVSSTARPARPSWRQQTPAGRCRPTNTPSPRHLHGHGPTVGAHAGVDHGQDHPGPGIAPPARAPVNRPHVVRQDIVGDVDHGRGGRHRPDHGLDHADELVDQAVVAQEGDGVVPRRSARLGVLTRQVAVDVSSRLRYDRPTARQGAPPPVPTGTPSCSDTRSSAATSATVTYGCANPSLRPWCKHPLSAGWRVNEWGGWCYWGLPNSASAP